MSGFTALGDKGVLGPGSPLSGPPRVVLLSIESRVIAGFCLRLGWLIRFSHFFDFFILEKECPILIGSEFRGVLLGTSLQVRVAPLVNTFQKDASPTAPLTCKKKRFSGNPGSFPPPFSLANRPCVSFSAPFGPIPVSFLS